VKRVDSFGDFDMVSSEGGDQGEKDGCGGC
jgi:hypothetical protein